MSLVRHLRSGFSLVEFLLFLGVLAGLGTAVVTMLVWGQDARLQQRTAAEVEQTGVRLLTTFTRYARRSELVLDPPTGQTGSVLTLQMAGTSEFPTIFAASTTGAFLLIQRDEIQPLTSPAVSVTDLTFTNTSAGNAKGVYVSFRLETVVPIPSHPVYSKEFRGAATLFPDDLSQAGGCGSCAMTGCVAGTYHWAYCAYQVCTPHSAALACE